MEEAINVRKSFDWVDTQSLAKKGVIYCNAGAACTESVADAAIWLILSTFRAFTWSHTAARSCDPARFSDAQKNIAANTFNPNGHSLGIIGLGRMGGNIARRLMKHGHEVAVYDRSAETVAGLGKEGAVTADSLDGVIAALAQPRAIWVMLPAGEPTEQTIAELADRLAPGDVIIDGGNTYYKDDIRRAKTLAEKGIDYVDVGTSGGVWGLERGYCMMIGGKSEAVERLEARAIALGATIGLEDLPAVHAALRAAAAGSAQASASTGMPLSLSTVCSSPAWNISITMSQPPTNSPLT